MVVHHSLVDSDLQRLHNAIEGRNGIFIGAEPLPAAFPFALYVLGMHGSPQEGRVPASSRRPLFLPLDELDELPRFCVLPEVSSFRVSGDGEPIEGLASPVVVCVPVRILRRREPESTAEQGAEGWGASGDDAKVELKPTLWLGLDQNVVDAEDLRAEEWRKWETVVIRSQP